MELKGRRKYADRLKRRLVENTEYSKIPTDPNTDWSNMPIRQKRCLVKYANWSNMPTGGIHRPVENADWSKNK
jgi:hypothetical protein